MIKKGIIHREKIHNELFAATWGAPGVSETSPLRGATGARAGRARLATGRFHQQGTYIRDWSSVTTRPVAVPPPGEILAHTEGLTELSPVSVQVAQLHTAHAGWPWPWCPRAGGPVGRRLMARVQLEGPRAVIKRNPNKYILSVTSFTKPRSANSGSRNSATPQGKPAGPRGQTDPAAGPAGAPAPSDTSSPHSSRADTWTPSASETQFHNRSSRG